MMAKFFASLLLIFFCGCTTLQAQRIHIPLNDDWIFQFGYDLRKLPDTQRVQLPHTWNAQDAYAGMNYFRGMGIYRKQIFLPDSLAGRRFFLRFEGVNSSAQVFINQRFVGSHEGGYTAFCLDISRHVRAGSGFLLTVQASNAYHPAILPISGDFNVYGGIHRPVSLLITTPACISPVDHGSPGVFVQQTRVSAKQASLLVRTKLLLQAKKNLRLRTTVMDKTGQQVVVKEQNVKPAEYQLIQPLTLQNPRLWQGKKDPYLYRLRVQLFEGAKLLDQVDQPLGLRHFRADADSGFFLNGQPYPLRGICRHEEWQGKGSALSQQDHETDFALLQEMGANALRMAHYPHSQRAYELADSLGIVVYTEIPLVGPGGYPGAGYTAHPALHQHARQLLTELIRQRQNHPSVFCWGLFNELKKDWDNPEPFIESLNDLAHEEDGSRPTVLASFTEGRDTSFRNLSDLMAWNKYFGWYGGQPRMVGAWADEVRTLIPGKTIGLSEYGAGASIRHQQDSLKAPNPNGRWHPENWQTYFHEENWKQIHQRPFLWGSFIWLLADFGSAVRSEGELASMNDKGLLSHDRATRKDAFYFYKAQWNPAHMLHLVGKRASNRRQATTSIKAYCNLPLVELWVNGQRVATQAPDAYRTVEFSGVRLQAGENRVVVKAKYNSTVLQDEVVWVLESPAAGN